MLQSGYKRNTLCKIDPRNLSMAHLRSHFDRKAITGKPLRDELQPPIAQLHGGVAINATRLACPVEAPLADLTGSP
jgi:hypothetical protein